MSKSFTNRAHLVIPNTLTPLSPQSHRNIKITRELREEIKSRYQLGVRVKQLAEEYRVGITTIKRHLGTLYKPEATGIGEWVRKNGSPTKGIKRKQPRKQKFNL